MSTHKQLATLTGHTNSVNAIALSVDRLASASADGTIRLWDVRTHKQLGTSSVRR